MDRRTLGRFFVVFVWLGLTAGGVRAQDYVREQRWHDEVVPGLVVGDAVKIASSSGREFLGIYTEVQGARIAVVIVHGIGVHPDHGVIGTLRARLADLGYTTLSIQMPVLEKNARAEDYYPALFPDAADRIGRAAAWLRAKGHMHLVLVSHSMGSWMANVYLDQSAQPFTAWVCMGLTGGFRSQRLGINWPWLSLDIPVLDVYGEHDLPPSVEAAARRARSIAGIRGSRQVRIAGADHFYTRAEAPLVAAIDEFLKGLP